MTAAEPGATTVLRGLLDATGGWWSSARVRVVRGGGVVPEGAARLLLRRPLMGVPAGVRVEDAAGRVVARALADALDEHDALRVLLDPLALATGLPPVAGALPSRARRDAVAALRLCEVREVVVDGTPAVQGDVAGLGPPQRGRRTAGPTSVVLDRGSGLPLEVGPRGGSPALVLRVEELDLRLEDDVFAG
ncbi:hypothetical protein WDZ17_03905 [Pseudokineococcus basanitobsidens]|uniref:UTRA domain-containing protein n=1 Tax=Pseudokineococcus basanitobsidens TaxID=1926649 RepID=A0ABU8RHB7_9ACTN